MSNGQKFTLLFLKHGARFLSEATKFILSFKGLCVVLGAGAAWLLSH
jgi:hypothetical protein